MSKIVIDVEENFHKAVRIAAIEHGETMKDFIVRVVLSSIKPNSSDARNIDFQTELKTSMKENKSILKELAHK